MIHAQQKGYNTEQILRGLCLLGVHGPPPAPKDAHGLRPYTERVAGLLHEGRLAQAAGPCAAGAPVASENFLRPKLDIARAAAHAAGLQNASLNQAFATLHGVSGALYVLAPDIRDVELPAHDKDPELHVTLGQDL